MSIISYDALKVPHLKEILSDVQGACQALDIAFYAIGALARNIQNNPLVSSNETLEDKVALLKALKIGFYHSLNKLNPS